MRHALLIIGLFISFNAFAGFAGDWIGWGTWKFKGEGDGVYCSPMTMTWSESKTSVGIEKGYFDCELVAMHLGKTKWELRDSKLYDEANQEKGFYDGQNFEVYMPSPNENTTIFLKVRREANHIDYEEIWFNRYEKVYVIQGRLFTQGQ